MDRPIPSRPIKADPNTGVGGGKSTIVTLTIASNYKNESTDTYPRSGNVVFSGGKTSLTIPVSQLGHKGYIDPSLGIGGIPDINEFRDFIAAVNEGGSITRWMNPVGEVELQADLDLAELSAGWVPIGAVEQTGNGNNACKPVGNAFTGKFNGGGHTLRNFHVSKNLEDVANGATFGLFGVLDHAVVKDLHIETDFTVSANGTADVGVVAGTVLDGRRGRRGRYGPVFHDRECDGDGKNHVGRNHSQQALCPRRHRRLRLQCF